MNQKMLAIGKVALIFISFWIQNSIEFKPWELPVVPDPPPSSALGKGTTDKLIPRHLWIAVRNASDELNYQMPGLFERNPNWEVHICSNEMKDEFMNTVFQNTSLLWAYNMISPAAGAAKADLWRYAVLWTYGGAYIDDDSDMRSPLDKVVEPTDTLIVSYERNGFNGNRCYIPRYHLSDFSTYRNASLRSLNVFHNRILLNWAMFAAPGHPILQATMANAVEILQHEYRRDTVMRFLNAAFKWEAVMCATGPSLLTSTAREEVIKNTPGSTLKLAHNDFKDYGGKFKAVNTPVKNDPKHYMNTMNKVELLSSYLPEPVLDAEYLKKWQGTPIQGQNAKEIFLIDHGTKRSIPTFDTLMALNFTMADVIVVSDNQIKHIKSGPSMPPLDYTGTYPIH
jgi:mannosyltransferase OCH1-like enzyme